MIRGIIVGVMSFVGIVALAVFFIYPWIFSIIQPLFNNEDIGALVAVTVCVMVSGPLVAGGIFLGLFIGALVSAIFDSGRRY